MAARRDLTPEQQSLLLEWLAADFPAVGIKRGFVERGWLAPSDRMLSYYRRDFAADLAALRAARRESALTSGLARKEERVAALVDHANALRSIVWITDDKGRLWNEKAWRETLDDIARELGERASRHEISGRDGGPITFERKPDLSKLTAEELMTVETLLAKAEATE